MKIGKRIKKWRKSAKMTQQQLADAVGCSLRTIVRIESCNPKHNITLHRINSICNIFGYVAEVVAKKIILEPKAPETQAQEDSNV